MTKAKVATKSVLPEDAGVAFDFADGQRLELPFSVLSTEIIAKLAIHGAKQKVGDSYSGESDPAAARALATKVVEQLQKGEWGATREGGGGRISDIAQALARITGQAVEACVAKLAEMDTKAKKDLRAHPKVKTALAQIALEKAEAQAAKAGDLAFEL